MWFRTHYRLIDRENFGAEIWTTWDFYRKGYLIVIKTRDIEDKKNYDHEKKELYIYMQILELKIPKEIEDQKMQILKDIKEAFEDAYGNPADLRDKDNKTCKVDLEYEGEII